ncbi:MAG TPA: hypothetical protein VFV94_13600 [Polyangiaceae bacterium]|nr:hypothetical protein [Polyangiaceae bacterium]
MRRAPFPAHRFGVALTRLAAGLAVVAATATASAEPEFPGVIQELFQSSCAPQCTLCHTSPQGGEATVKFGEKYVDGMNPSNRGFGVFVANLGARGNTVLNKDTLVAKLKLLKTDPCQKDAMLGSTADMRPCDTDGDGMSDYDELDSEPARDPEVSGVGNGSVCPAYGCGASIGTLPRDADATGRAGAVMAALGVALVLARRVRR